MTMVVTLLRRGVSLRFAAIVLLPAIVWFAALSPLLAQTMEMPARKAGLWEMKMEMAGGQMPAMTMQHCTDETTDKQMNATFSPMSKELCSKNDIRKTATGYVIDSVCTAGGVASTSHAEIVGDFSSAYTMKVSSQTKGGPPGVPPNSTMTIEAKWTGACKTDQKPGDIMMPGGMKMNIKDMQKLIPKQ